MEHGHALLHTLIQRLRPWFGFIQRATHATTVEVATLTMGEFNVVVTGTARDGSRWSVTVPFTREGCFGPTYTQPPGNWFVVTRPCDHARGIVKTVLEQRGAL